MRTKRYNSHQLETLTPLNSAVDVRRARRELTAGELGRVFVAARDSAREFRGLAGRDRFYLYLVAAGTGFRASALGNLTPADFDLESSSPTVTLSARFNKSRRVKVQPLPPDVAAELRGYLAGKPSNSPLWPGTWAKGRRGAEMLRIDLEAAGIAYAVEGPDGPEYADFHSLRHSYLTLGGRSGIDLRTLQELAGHSTPTLTARYSHRRLHDLTGAVGKLPNLVPTTPTAPNVAEIPLRATGTEGAKGVVPGVVTGGTEPHQSALKYTLGIFGGTSEHSPKTLENEAAGASQHRPASIGTSTPGGNRTHNHSLRSPADTGCKPLSHQQVTSSDAAGRSAGRSDQRSEGGITDPELARVVEAWPTLRGCEIFVGPSLPLASSEAIFHHFPSPLRPSYPPIARRVRSISVQFNGRFFLPRSRIVANRLWTNACISTTPRTCSKPRTKN